MKLKELALYVAIGMLTVLAVLIIGVFAIWIYDQPREVRNTAVIVFCVSVCIGMAIVILTGMKGR